VKKPEPSIGLIPFANSLSIILTLAVESAPRIPPEGLLRVTSKLSGPSRYESSMIKTEIVFDV
jgi:hypothetical protein